MAFYPSDWLGGTARLSRLHRSVYFDVCCYNWDMAKPVPAMELAVMVADLPNGMEIVDQLVAIGKLIRHEDGSVENPKAMAEAEKAYHAWDAMSRGGKEGRSRVGKGPASPPAKGVKAPKARGVRQNQNQNQNQISPNGDKYTRDAPTGVSAETWDAFIDLRRSHKAPLTDRAMQLIEKAIAESSASPEDTVAKSVLSGWRGVFPVEGKGRGNGKPSGWLNR